MGDDIRGKKVGVIKELMSEGLAPEVQQALQNAIETYKKLGCEIVEISLDKLKYSIGIYYILATAECSSNLARFDGGKYGYRTSNPENLMEMYTKSRAEGFGPEVKRRIMLGTYALYSGYYDAYYKKAQQLRALVTEEFVEAFKKVDVLISPTCPNTAFEMGAKSIVEKVIPLIDNFERGLATVSEEDKENPFVTGMDKVYSQFITSMEEAGVTAIEAVGKEFDPNMHNAVMHVEDESLGDNIVAEELQKGYMYKDSVVRYSMVKVAN